MIVMLALLGAAALVLKWRWDNRPFLSLAAAAVLVGAASTPRRPA